MMHNWFWILVDPKCICVHNSVARVAQSVPDPRIVIHSRITLRKGANPNGELSRRRKSVAYGIRFTALFYASTIFPAVENRGTISRLARECRRVVRHLPLKQNSRFVCTICIYRAPKESSSLWPTCSPRREMKWFILRSFVWNDRHIMLRPKNARRDSFRVQPRP